MWLHLVLAGVLTASGDPDAEIDGPMAIKARFLDEVRACGVTPAFEPDLRLETTPWIVTYRWEPRTVLIPRWSELPDPFRAFITDWAANTAPGEAPSAFFGDVFQDFMVARELGHWLQHQAGRHRTLSNWDGELEANRFAIAFAERRDGHDSTARRVDRVGWLLTLPYQPPPDRDPIEYFNTDYDALMGDPAAYSWFQAGLMRAAWEDHRENDFCDLVRLNAPSSPTASPE